ncbi:formate--tetrahydrofolate ligase [Dolosicoccus paucivorans]|uniref:Formate--tetrahydrofolate ligase n=1 Tax=Dolosicoccus paucivorans TaxID=84521 RepID=A0A2N6SPX4_9LACT|nr:formate--tetrahydrofolate ligase [Dolosicoccus paucivorans]PMB84144.1 formate--tetrahydrofolate ligase [Dolosicoccus paucivorans]PMC59096.1 formate--tetrahydrofolate ligase [Dolosicoccus paucivorans]
MTHLTDIEIAQQVTPKPINEIAQKAGVPEDALDLYGSYKAKIDVRALQDQPASKGKLILVTAISPTPAGEGKTTMSVGLADGLSYIGEKAMLALREPSLGPVFGVKGGAAGGGYAQVIPMEDINLHFTGDLHAIGAANNLLAAMIDNHIHHGNALNIDTRSISWKRVVDMNDRQLRQIVDGLGGATNGVPREDGYDITVASEIMAVLCLAEDLKDLKERLSSMVVAYNFDKQPITAGDLKAAGALATLLKEAIKPNLVQTLEQTPALIHGGPFANIAHGCNSVVATKTAMHLADYTVTEAGFGADLGAEKFLDIKGRMAGIRPDAVVVVATVRALKMHGGVKKTDLKEPNPQAVKDGLPNLMRHVDNLRQVYGLNVVVGINQFTFDTQEELDVVLQACAEKDIPVEVADVWGEGGKGASDLAKRVVELANQPQEEVRYAYDLDTTIQEKLDTLVSRIYGGNNAKLLLAARRQARQLEELGYGNLPICVAKTQYSFTDQAGRVGAPTDFDVTIRELRLSAGAGFIVALAGNIMTMPGLPKQPAAESIDIDVEGNITGLF